MFRFKLRTLLVATALVAVFLGLQVHVHNKAKRFLEEIRVQPAEFEKRLISDAGEQDLTSALQSLSANIATRTFGDIVRCQRRVDITFATFDPPSQKRYDVRVHKHIYRIGPFGENCEVVFR